MFASLAGCLFLVSIAVGVVFAVLKRPVQGQDQGDAGGRQDQGQGQDMVTDCAADSTPSTRLEALLWQLAQDMTVAGLTPLGRNGSSLIGTIKKTGCAVAKPGDWNSVYPAAVAKLLIDGDVTVNGNKITLPSV